MVVWFLFEWRRLVNKQQACEWIKEHGGFDSYRREMVIKDGDTGECCRVWFDEYAQWDEKQMSARDRTYTGKVGEWGLPDGTVMVLDDGGDINTFLINESFGFAHDLGNFGLVSKNYRIKSLPDGYEFNKGGEIVKVEQKHWNGKEPLEVGMWFIESINQSCVQAAYINGLDVAFNYKDGLGASSTNSCKPIDTRTDKQKAVDSLPMYATNSLLANNIIDAIISGEVYGVKWVGKDETK